ncbi:MAG: 50S ribosomal protein L33 [Candidatus Paceibacterota bacterium]
MAKSKFSENLIKLKCSVCKRINYYTRKNKKTNEKKLELSKHCKWCRKHTKHVEIKK